MNVNLNILLGDIMSFQERVWDLLKQIPKGKVTSYKIIAEKLGSKAYRAVGNACHNNPFAQVPCHRVVNHNGYIGGYGSEIEKKIELLKKEGIKVKNNKIADFENVLFRFE